MISFGSDICIDLCILHSSYALVLHSVHLSFSLLEDKSNNIHKLKKNVEIWKINCFSQIILEISQNTVKKKEPFYDIFLLCRNTDLTARNAINVAWFQQIHRSTKWNVNISPASVGSTCVTISFTQNRLTFSTYFICTEFTLHKLFLKF